MKLLKYITFGILGGLIFAIIAFVLITPYLRGNSGAILFWGFQGFLFSISCYLLNAIFSQRINRLTKNILVGALSGLFSTIFNVVVTVRNFFAQDASLNIVIPPQLIKNLFFELSLYVVGCVIIGIFVGMIINYKAIET